MKVLIAFPRRDLELADTLWEELDSRAGSRITIVKVTSQREARRAIAGTEFSVIVVHEQLPRAASEAAHPDGGLELIERLRVNNIDTRVALLHSLGFTEKQHQQLSDFGGVTPIQLDADGIAKLVDYVLTKKSPTARLDITLDLTPSPEAWKYRISGDKYLRTPVEGLLCLKAREVRTLQRLSMDLDSDPSLWHERLELLRDNLWDCLVEEQTHFSKQLTAAMEKSGQIENTRLRFRTGPDNHGVVFEAIRHPNAPSDYWMLGAPVYRTLGRCGESKAEPLFQSGERRGLNCLIVLADASGYVEYEDQLEPRKYEPIRRGRHECQELYGMLTQARADKVNIDRIEFAGEKVPVTMESLLKLLGPDQDDRERRWDLVHFVGHTDFINDACYFIMPGSDGGAGAQAVPAMELTPLLGNSRLVYLSSCDSASAALVFRLAERGISSLLGFCMPIPDSLAVEHAQEFYRQLFRTRSTEDAFLATRQHFHQMKPESRIWARTMLIQQT